MLLARRVAKKYNMRNVPDVSHKHVYKMRIHYHISEPDKSLLFWLGGEKAQNMSIVQMMIETNDYVPQLTAKQFIILLLVNIIRKKKNLR